VAGRSDTTGLVYLVAILACLAFIYLQLKMNTALIVAIVLAIVVGVWIESRKR
jgi:hypothetical protein